MQLEEERSLCQRYANRIRSYGRCHLRDEAAAEDLVQQVLLVLLQSLRAGRVREVENLDKYVFGICRNATMEMRRGTIRARRIAEQSAVAGPPEGYEPSGILDVAHLDRCLERLDARARGVVLATFVDERDAQEVGRSMGLSAGNVRVIRHRALAQLQRCMQPSEL